MQEQRKKQKQKIPMTAVGNDAGYHTQTKTLKKF